MKGGEMMKKFNLKKLESYFDCGVVSGSGSCG